MTKYAARSLVLLFGDPSAVEVGQVNDLAPAGSSRNLIDASAYGDDWMDYVLGQQDGDEVDMVIAYDPADDGHSALIEAYDGATLGHFEYQHEESDFHVGFPGLITKCSRGGAKDGLLLLNLTVKIVSPGVEDIDS